MPFTLIHGLVSFLVIAAVSPDKRLWVLSFWAGMMADLDGLPIFFDTQLYLAIHHELLHPPVYAIVFGLLFAYALFRLFKMNFAQSFAVFAVSYALHPLTDVVFTAWPVKLLWPLSNELHSWPVLAGYNLILALAVIGLSIVVVARANAQFINIKTKM